MFKRKFLSGGVLGAALAGAFTAAGPATAAPAQYQCYDFGGLAPDTSYNVGDVINARHATIKINPYHSGGGPTDPKVRHAKVVPSKIAGGAAPEMALYLVTVKVEPDSPVTRVKMNIAQNISQTGGFATANLEVNGQKREVPGGVAAMNGHTLGNADLTSSMASVADNWHAGTLEMRATAGNSIKSFSIGGHQMRLDNFCFAK